MNTKDFVQVAEAMGAKSAQVVGESIRRGVAVFRTLEEAVVFATEAANTVAGNTVSLVKTALRVVVRFE